MFAFWCWNHLYNLKNHAAHEYRAEKRGMDAQRGSRNCRLINKQHSSEAKARKWGGKIIHNDKNSNQLQLSLMLTQPCVPIFFTPYG
ncbi:unnamed protein product [Leptidea sinapis]|uniref:Uncharacterized protein n=1 Tax=Leptidea sinapis TaxID=189913 RepID=A0A5E4R0B7_9NEOP|nr:unnamed protein product [Leptidea sinapis]